VISRVFLGVVLAVVTVVGSISSYLYLDLKQSKVAVAAIKPPDEKPTPRAFYPVGTLFVTQNGAIYSYSFGKFRQLTGEQGWMQPSLMPNGNLLVVKRGTFSSDVFIMSRYGRILGQLSNNVAPRRSYDTGDNHWAFYPTMTADGRTIFLSYDQPKGGYEVDLSVWSMPVQANGISRGTDWSYSQGYTGGDMQPIPVQGGIIYTKYLRAPDGTIHSQIWFLHSPAPNSLYAGKPLTPQGMDCRSPNVSPDGGAIAMICTYGKQLPQLVIAPFGGSVIGAMRAVVTNQMVAQPVWAPDMSGIAYLAPAVPDMPFQLWFLPVAAYNPPAAPASPTPTPGVTPAPVPSPSPAPVIKPIQLTVSVGLDATSTLAWAA
jgi:hypothetical protein